MIRLQSGSPELHAWLWAQLKESGAWLVATRRLSKRKARKWGLIADPYRDQVEF